MEILQENFISIITIIISVISGGLAGHLYSQYKIEKRNRKQKISINTIINNLFKPNDLISPKIIISEDDKNMQFNNLFLVQITIINKGNIAFSKFDLGINLIESHKFIKFDYFSKSHKHEVIINGDEPEFDHQVNYIDLILDPFNREDEYKINLQIHSDDINQLELENIKFSTKNDVVINEVNSLKKENSINFLFLKPKLRLNFMLLMISLFVFTFILYKNINNYVEVKSTIEELQDELSESNDIIESLEYDLSESQYNVEELQNFDLDNMTDEINELSSRLEELEGFDLEDITSEINELSSKVELLENKNDD